MQAQGMRISDPLYVQVLTFLMAYLRIQLLILHLW
ncbi:hypothetical protein [Aphanizomenon sp. UHCC 0183]|nr:hypothetical protein [Aphanizomenon sp. UHCC 0183]